MSDYIFEFRSIDPARRYSEENTSKPHKFVDGFNRNGLQNVPQGINVDDIGSQGKIEFIIKPYQRGFRWNASDNVRKLLDDLFEYSKDHSALFEKTRINYTKNFTEDEFDFYCLQTLTVRGEELGKWEVIDGQQRLTCIFLIYMLLSSFCDGQTATPYDIYYQREGEKFPLSEKIREYLLGLSKSSIQPRDVLGNENLDTDRKKAWFISYKEGLADYFANEQVISGSYEIDSYYIHSAMKEIISFIETGKDQQDIKTLLDCIKRNVYFLWYVIPSDSSLSSEDIFLKINSGSIPLTNAELVKSLVLQSDPGNLKVNSRQWEAIEKGLCGDELWSFIAGTYTSDTRIDLLLDIFVNNNGGILSRNGHSNNQYELFDWYNEYRKQNPEGFSIFVLKGIQDIFDRICEWHDDVQIYHYVGLLSVMLRLGFRFEDTYKNQQEMLKILLFEAEDAVGKEDFVNRLQKHIAACLKDKLNKNNIPSKVVQLVENTDTFNNDFLNYFDENKRIEAILWLMNIWETINSVDNKVQVKKDVYIYKDIACRRFPFSEAMSGAWSLEHIFPQHPDEKDKEALKQYNANVSGMLQNSRLSEDDVHSIKNLALLKRTTNTTLQNEMLWKKRIKLVDEIGKGAFVPASTVNAFMLYYNNVGADSNVTITADAEENWNYWTLTNASKYEDAIASCLRNIEEGV